MALYSLPAVAPEVARDLHVNGTLVGSFVATGLRRRHPLRADLAGHGPPLRRRASDAGVLLAAAGMLALAALGSGVTGLALAAVVLGLGYGAAAPASTHLLVPQTPQPVFNLVMSLRQIGVPLGGVLAALILPPLTLAIGWRGALLAELGPVLLLIVAMEIPRRRWDHDREPGRRVLGRTLLQPFALLREQRFRRLSVAAFVYAGLALCLVAFMTVQLTTVVGLTLVQAGQILAAYQIAGSLSRPVWGWIADRFLTPAQTLAVLGIGMAVASALTGFYGPRWPVLGDHGQRAARRLHLRRLHRRRLRRIRRPRRFAPDRGDRPRHRDLLRRRHGRATGVRRGGHRAGRLPRQLPHRRGLRAGERAAAAVLRPRKTHRVVEAPGRPTTRRNSRRRCPFTSTETENSMPTPQELEAKLWKSLESDMTMMLGLDGAEDGHVRPMTAQVEGAKSPIWFFAAKDAALYPALGSGHRAIATFASKGHDLFASLRGNLVLDNDRAVIDRLWNKYVAAWYQGGKDDPNLALIRFDAETAEIWESGSSIVAGIEDPVRQRPEAGLQGEDGGSLSAVTAAARARVSACPLLPSGQLFAGQICGFPLEARDQGVASATGKDMAEVRPLDRHAAD